MAGESAHALIEQRGHILIVTMNRPEARNALSGEMLSIMVEAWDRSRAKKCARPRTADRRPAGRSTSAGITSSTTVHPGPTLIAVA